MFVYKIVAVQILLMFDVQNCTIILPYYGLPL